MLTFSIFQILVCDGAVIDSVGSAQKLKGCTYVNGSLEIQIQGGGMFCK